MIYNKKAIINYYYKNLKEKNKVLENKITKNFCKLFIEKFFIIFKNFLKDEQTVEIRGLGTFKTIKSLRKLQNFQTKSWRIEEKKKVKFKRAKNFNV
ncbi:MAG TPA: HU family DNA-binding protein [bacterium]|nr:HU family DNA-binding protein [bacterium]HOL48759.1 HU family DNA-binding protein [bacterium]HPQ19557.1 HU family DNA-binding protein [bacterium]